MAADQHWRHTANIVRVWIVDARGFCTFPGLLVVKSLILLGTGVVFLVFFFILERKGLDFDNFVRKLRCAITGPVKEVRRMR